MSAQTLGKGPGGKKEEASTSLLAQPLALTAAEWTSVLGPLRSTCALEPGKTASPELSSQVLHPLC